MNPYPNVGPAPDPDPIREKFQDPDPNTMCLVMILYLPAHQMGDHKSAKVVIFSHATITKNRLFNTGQSPTVRLRGV